MRNHRVRVLTLIILACIPGLLHAQGSPLLLTDSDARKAAMCCNGDAAGSELRTLRAGIGGGVWAAAENSILLYADARYKLPFGLEVGLDAAFMKDTPYEESNNRGMFFGVYAPYETSMGMSAAYDINGGLRAGIRMRIYQSSLARNASATVFGGDVFCTYRTGILDASLEICNLGSRMNYGMGSYSQPALARLCATVQPLKGLSLAAEGDCLFAGAVMGGVGAEYTIANLVFVRAGYHYGDSSKAIPSYAACGLGLDIRGITVDACGFFASKALSGTMIIRLGYSF